MIRYYELKTFKTVGFQVSCDTYSMLPMFG